MSGGEQQEGQGRGLVYLSIAIAIAAIAVIFGVYRWFNSVSFEEEELDRAPENVADLGSGPTVTPDSLGERGIGRLVGLILIADQDNPRVFDPEQVLVHFRPSRDALLVEPLDQIRYQGKVTRGFSLEGGYASFASGLKEDEVAEVVIKDDFTVLYDPDRIPLGELAALERQEDKRYYFVEAATLTSVVYQKYRRSKSHSKIAGSAFKAGGDIYVSTEKKAQTGKVRLTGWYLTPLSREETLPPSVGPAIAAAQPLDAEQSATILDHLRKQPLPGEMQRQEITIEFP